MKMKVATIAELPEGRPVCVKPEGANILLVRRGDGVHALENRCPHLGLPMKRGTVIGDEIVCPFHGSRFDLASGENRDWVSKVAGMTLPAWSSALLSFGRKPQAMRSYPVAIEDGAVLVEL